MGEWTTKPLGELISFISKGIPPKYENEENTNTIRVLNQKCNRNFKISYDSCRFHNNCLKPVNDNKFVKTGDVLINSTGVGTAGRIAQIWDVPYKTTYDGHMILLRPNEEVDIAYFGYAIKSHQHEIELLAEGSTGQTELNRTRLCNEILISFPKEISEQKKISELLLNIDRKIAINSAINDNLEQQVLAVYRDRFINTKHKNCYICRDDEYLSLIHI